MDTAFHDYYAGRPLPGLPNLKLPVFIMPGACVFGTLDELTNQNSTYETDKKSSIIGVASEYSVSGDTATARCIEAWTKSSDHSL